MREVLHRHYARVFRAGERVLDVGCGTGIDAVFLAQGGVDVVAVDFSPEMVAQCRAKASSAGLTPRVDARVLSITELGTLRGERFDGLVSAFAGLNTLPDLHQFAADASQLVKPGGRVILHLLNRFSLWEWLGYVSHANWRAARDVGRRRTRAFTIGGRRVPHHRVLRPRSVRAFFPPHLRAARRVRPRQPAPAAHGPPHSRAGRPHLERLDTRTRHWPLLKNAGRFWVLDLERRPT